MLFSFNSVTSKSHHRKVLQGRLSGTRLLDKLKAETVKKRQELRVFFELNNALMWHMAHCPDPEDRKQVLDLGEEIEPTLLKPLIPRYSYQDREHLSSPTPFSPIDIAFSRVPGYKDQFIPVQDLIDPKNAYIQMRRAMLFRNRNVYTPLDRQNGLLAQEPSRFFSCPLSDAEHAFAFEINFMQVKHLLLFFVKNNWPMGYGFAMPEKIEGVNVAGIAYHIFKEFRGTSSSAAFFGSFLALVQEMLHPSTLLFPMATKKIDPLKEYTKDAARFLKRYGFSWAPEYDNLMFKEVGK